MSEINAHSIKRIAKQLKKEDSSKSYCKLLDEVTRETTNKKNYHEVVASNKSLQLEEEKTRKSEIRNQIQKALDEDPELNDFGIGLFDSGRGLSYQDRVSKLEENRELLLNRYEEFQKACEWFKSKKKIKTFNYKRSSYGLKHEAERVMNIYISNGVLIAAAFCMGFKYKKKSFNPNVYFNISQLSLKT